MGEIKFKDKKEINKMLRAKKKEEFTVLPVFCIFGIIQVLGKQILLLVTSISVAAHFRNRPILKIEEVKGKIIKKKKNPQESGEELLMIMEYIRKYMKKGFYFSHFYDLTTKFPWSLHQHGKDLQQTFPKEPWEEDRFNLDPPDFQTKQEDPLQFKNDLDLLLLDSNMEIPKPNKSRPIQSMNPRTHSRMADLPEFSSEFSQSKDLRKFSVLNTKFNDRIESIFAWNLNSLSDFYASPTWNDSMNVFFPPIIQGHVDSIEVGKEMQMVVISRRSYIMGGTRYNSRGINPSGFVGNYVETEQIMDVGRKVFTYIQIRGSVPFFWNQKNVSREVIISQTKEINQQIMLKHFKMLRDRFNFKNVVILNLLSKWKKNEVRLGKYLHKIYLENFSDKKSTSLKENPFSKKKASIHDSMDVDWLDSMNTTSIVQKKSTKQPSPKQNFSLESIEKNKTKEKNGSISSNQKKVIEEYLPGESLTGVQFSTVPFGDMNVYIQHIDFHSIGRPNSQSRNSILLKSTSLCTNCLRIST